MTEVSINISPAGYHGTRLTAIVGNNMNVTWNLTDQQLAYLAAEAVSILKSRSQAGVLKAVDHEEVLKRLQCK